MVDERIVQELARIVGADQVSTDSADRILHAFDATQGRFLPEVVVHATTTDQVSRVVRLAHEHRIPILPRGAGSGFTGGSLPIRGGIVLVLTRADRPAGRGQQLQASPVKQLALARGIPVYQPRTLRDPEAQAADES